MEAVIIEDEYVAAENLKRLLQSVDDSIEVIAVLQSVEESVEWFTDNVPPDVVFIDIHLADGDAFLIFDKVEIRCPLIFTTSYDEYALKAFEVNSIDYLLKPIGKKDLEKALNKLRFFTFRNNNDELVSQIVQSINESKTSYKKHFLIPYRDKLIPISADEIAYIHSEYKMANIICFDGRQLSVDTSLDELSRQLDPAVFFRANRQYIVSHASIVDLTVWFGGKLAINLSVKTPERILVSRARAVQFKEWYMDNSSGH